MALETRQFVKKFWRALFFIVWVTNSAQAQSVLNGSFEMDDLACGYNLANITVTNRIQHVTAFGLKTEIDILNDTCGYGPAFEGRNFLALYSNLLSDAISFKLSAALEVGKTYELKFACKEGEAPGLFPGKLRIGTSNAPDILGKMVYTSTDITNQDWIVKEATFTVTEPAQYITVTIETTSGAWIFIDDFQLGCPLVNLGNDTLVCNANEVELKLAGNYEHILWSDGSTSTTLKLINPGLYWVEATANGCVGKDSILITEFEHNCACSLYLPNVFSPNSDGINDLFLPQSPCELLWYELEIYDRWGQKVFESTDSSVGWDGNFKGKPCVLGTYVYWVKYGFSYSSFLNFEEGEILLVR